MFARDAAAYAATRIADAEMLTRLPRRASRNDAPPSRRCA
jgi:hypothetical protein